MITMDSELMEPEEEKLEIPPIDVIRMELAREEARHEFRKTLLNMAGW